MASNNGKYRLSVYIKQGSPGWQWWEFTTTNPTTRAWFDLTNGVVGTNNFESLTMVDVGDGWYQITAITPELTATSEWYLTPRNADNSSATATGDGVSKFYVTGYHVARYPCETDYVATTSAVSYSLPYQYDTSGDCKGLLVESQRTNLCLQSADFTTTWTTTECTVSANAATAPNGLTHADKLVPSTNNVAHYVNQSITFTAAAYTFSAYCKSAGYDFIQIFDSVAGTAYANFNLSSGTVGNSSDYTASITSVGNGWYRIQIVFTMTASARTMRLCVLNADTASRAPAFAGDGTSGVLVWGAQAELGSFPTSYIPTYAGTVTRNGDIVSLATSTFPHSITAGTSYIEATSDGTGFNEGYIFRNTATGTSDRLPDHSYGTGRNGGGGSIRCDVFTGGALQADLGYSATFVPSVPIKSSVAYAANDFSFVAEGGNQLNDFAGSLPSTINLLELGNRGNGSQLNGHIKEFSYVPRRKDDIELAVETGYSLPTGYSSYGAWSLFGTENSALALDFTDQSIVNTRTPLVSQGTVSDGSLVGPGAALTYTSPANKLVRQSDGYYKYSAHNLFLQSEDFTTSWTNVQTSDSANTTTAPDGTTTADTITSTSATGACYVMQQPTTSGAAIHKFSVRFKAGTSRYIVVQTLGRSPTDDNADRMFIDTTDGSITLALGSAVASGTVTSLGDGWYLAEMLTSSYPSSTQIECRVSLTDVSTSETSVDNNGATVYLWGAHLHRYPAVTDYIKTTTAAVYSLPYEYDTSGNCEGLLIEEARTNLCLYSNALSTSPWTNTTTSYDTSTYTLTASGASSYARQTLTLSDSTTYNISAFISPGNSNWVYLFFRNKAAADVHLYFNASSGTFGTVTGITEYSAELAESGWYRVNFNVASSTGGTTPFVQIQHADGDGDISVTAGNTIKVRHVQVEAGTFPTSPIETFGATAARAVDSFSMSAWAIPYNDAAGSIYAYWQSFHPTATEQQLFVARKASTGTNDRVALATIANASRMPRSAVVSGGTTSNDGSANGVYVANTLYKTSFAVTTNDAIVALNGAVDVQDTSVTMPTGLDTIEIGQRAGNLRMTGYIRELLYVPRRKTDAELQTETA